MASTNIWDYSSTASSISTIEGSNVATGMSPGLVDDALRNIVAMLANSFHSGKETFLSTSSALSLALGGTGSALVDPNADRLMFWDDSASAVAWLDLGTGLSITGTTLSSSGANESIIIACSDETTAITTGTGKVTFRMPYAFTLTAVKASVTTAPTGSTIVIDINESGTTILSTKLSIDASEKTSATAASAAVISDASLAADAEITIDFDQVGSTIAGAGVKVYLIGHQ